MSGPLNTKSPAPGEDAADRQDADDGIPASERGKEEQMSFEQTQPSAVFGIVSATYLFVLILILVVAALYWWL